MLGEWDVRPGVTARPQPSGTGAPLSSGSRGQAGVAFCTALHRADVRVLDFDFVAGGRYSEDWWLKDLIYKGGSANPQSTAVEGDHMAKLAVQQKTGNCCCMCSVTGGYSCCGTGGNPGMNSPWA